MVVQLSFRVAFAVSAFQKKTKRRSEAGARTACTVSLHPHIHFVIGFLRDPRFRRTSYDPLVLLCLTRPSYWATSSGAHTGHPSPFCPASPPSHDAPILYGADEGPLALSIIGAAAGCCRRPHHWHQTLIFPVTSTEGEGESPSSSLSPLPHPLFASGRPQKAPSPAARLAFSYFLFKNIKL